MLGSASGWAGRSSQSSTCRDASRWSAPARSFPLQVWGRCSRFRPVLLGLAPPSPSATASQSPREIMLAAWGAVGGVISLLWGLGLGVCW